MTELEYDFVNRMNVRLERLETVIRALVDELPVSEWEAMSESLRSRLTRILDGKDATKTQ